MVGRPFFGRLSAFCSLKVLLFCYFCIKTSVPNSTQL